MKNVLKSLRGLRRLAKNEQVNVCNDGIFINLPKATVKIAIPFGVNGICEALPLFTAIIESEGVTAFVVENGKLYCNGTYCCDFTETEPFNYEPIETLFRPFNDSKAFRTFAKTAINCITNEFDSTFVSNYLALSNNHSYAISNTLALKFNRNTDTCAIRLDKDNLEILNKIDVLFKSYSYVNNLLQLTNDVVTVIFKCNPHNFNDDKAVEKFFNNRHAINCEFEALPVEFFSFVKSNLSAEFITISPNECRLDTGEKISISMPTNIKTTYLVKDIKTVSKYLDMVAFHKHGCAFIANDTKGLLANVFTNF